MKQRRQASLQRDAFLFALAQTGNFTIAADFAGLAQLAIGWGKSALDMRIAEKQSLMRARHKRFMTAAKSEADWQALMADAARHSWKDEAWTICFILIFFMCFVPSLQHHVATGFGILQTTPDWFQWAVLASIGASFGLRGFDKWQTKPPSSPKTGAP